MIMEWWTHRPGFLLLLLQLLLLLLALLALVTMVAVAEGDREDLPDAVVDNLSRGDLTGKNCQVRGGEGGSLTSEKPMQSPSRPPALAM